MRKKLSVFWMGLALMSGTATIALAGDKAIADLESNPSKYTDKTVKISGVVRDSDGVNIPILGIRGGCYKLDDGTGSLWVCSDRGAPTKGVQLKVKGVLQSGATINGKNYGLVLVEKDRKFRKK